MVRSGHENRVMAPHAIAGFRGPGLRGAMGGHWVRSGPFGTHGFGAMEMARRIVYRRPQLPI